MRADCRRPFSASAGFSMSHHEAAASANVLVAFAAKDGEVALDGRPGENSPYARALLRYLEEPGLELGNFFRMVRDEVL